MNQSINGVEIFSAGDWNGDKYSEADLDLMVKAFDETSVTLRPPLKLGHSDNQTLLQQDGMPAAGWIGKLYRVGEKLLADFVDIPSKIYDLIVKGAYKKVSSEILWNANLNGDKYPRMLCAVALLGADIPAVSNLKDILARYKLLTEASDIKNYAFNVDQLIIKSYVLNEGDTMANKTENEIKLELELETQKKLASDLAENVKKQEFALKSKDTELEDLQKYKSDAEKNLADARSQLADAELEKTLTSLITEKLITPAMKPFVKALLGEEKKEYTLSLDPKDAKNIKNFSKSELVKEVLSLHKAAAAVNFVESSVDGKVKGKDQNALHSEIEKYAKEHNVSYKNAYKVVTKNVA